jgi:hypothetical protein
MPTLFESSDFRNRLPQDIISKDVYFDSVGYVFRGLSWIDIAKRERNVCALQYAAHDIRQGIEQLLFEEIVLSVGTELDRKEYENCKGNSTKLHKVITRLNPSYKKLAEFTRAIFSVDLQMPPLITWDHKELMRLWGKISNYLHWAGEPAETVESNDWFLNGIATVGPVAEYLWNNSKSGYAGIMIPKNMHPEIRNCWERYLAGDVDLDAVKHFADIALPILKRSGDSDKERADA